MDLPILGVNNVVVLPDLVDDVEPHPFKLCYYGDVKNPLLVKTTLNGTKQSLLVSGSGPYISVSKNKTVNLINIHDEFFIIHLVVGGEIIQVDPGEV